MTQAATYFSTDAETYAAQMLETLSEWYQGDTTSMAAAAAAEALRVEEDTPALYDRLMETLGEGYDCLSCYFQDYCQTH